MAKVHVTYTAPVDDNVVVFMGGKRFIDRQALELDTEESAETAELINTLRTNWHFTVQDPPAQGWS